MKAIILAAGRGKRINKITKNIPKGLIKYRGKPLVEWQLDAIKMAGISKIGIVTGYRSNMFKKYNLVKFKNKKWSQTQMVASLMCASKWLKTSSCIVTYSDILYEASAIKKLIQSKADIAITYDPKWKRLWQKRFLDPLQDAETFTIKNKNQLSSIGEKPKNINSIHGQYMGLLRFTPKGWRIFQKRWRNNKRSVRQKLQITKVLSLVIKQDKIRILAVPYKKGWGEVDSLSDLKLLQQINFNTKNNKSR